MRPSIRISLDSWSKPAFRKRLALALIFSTLPACQNRAPSLRMLDHRAGYDDLDEREVGLYQRGKVDLNSPQAFNKSNALFQKSAPKVSRVYIYPHELPSKDYFWGGYVSLVVSPDEWVVENVDTNLSTPQQPGEATPFTAPLTPGIEKGGQK